MPAASSSQLGLRSFIEIHGPSVNGVTVRSADGSDKSLGDFAGNVLLIVNVASRCGFTSSTPALRPSTRAMAPRPESAGLPLQRLRRPRARHP